MHDTFNLPLIGTGPRPIPGLTLPTTLRLLVVAPHPDDFDAIGITLRFLARTGHSLDAGVMRTGSGVEDVYHPGFTQTELADLREREQRDSLRFFGLPQRGTTFFSLENDADDQPAETAANLHALEAFVTAKAPDVLFLPHGNDTNSGHRVMYALVRQVALRAGRPMALLLNRDAKTIAMRTDLYMPFGPDQAKWKAELLRFHDSQQQRNLRTRGAGFDDRVLQVNRQTARDLAITEEYAEAFEIERFT